MIDLYFGLLSMPHSWSVVSAHILKELKKMGLGDFKIYSTNGYDAIDPFLQQNIDINLINSISNKSSKKFNTSLSYTLPINLSKIPANNKIIIWNYEVTHLPNKKLMQLVNEGASLFLPSSNFSRDVFIEAGVDPDKTIVLPHGCDDAIYNPSIPPVTLKGIENKYKFLTIAIPHLRKGYRNLLEAYTEEFANDDSVTLIIKSSKSKIEFTGGMQAFHVDLPAEIERLKQKYKGIKIPQICMIEERLENLASLYNACDCVVLPTKGEGFSLTALESAFCKRPVITTNFSGHLDFLNKNNSFLIDYKLEEAPLETAYMREPGNLEPAYWAEPDKDHLKSLMRYVREHPEESKQKAEIAYSDTKDMTWKGVTLKLLELMKERNL